MISLVPYKFKDFAEISEHNRRLDYQILLSSKGNRIGSGIYRLPGTKDFCSSRLYNILVKFNPITENSKFVIVNRKGIEVRSFDRSQIPYLIENSEFYMMNGCVYHIKSGEKLPGNFLIETKEFIFMENANSYNPSIRGLYKIHKLTERTEFFGI